MTDRDRDADGVVAPIMPTGSGVADLEIAREQDALAGDGDEGIEDGMAPDDETPVVGGPAADESQAHPS